MLFEFCIAGWDINNDVYGKEKYGGLRCYILSKRTKIYSKSEAHQIFFTHEELDTYRKLNHDELDDE